MRLAASAAAWAVVLAPAIAVQAMPSARVAALRTTPAVAAKAPVAGNQGRAEKDAPRKTPETQSPVWVVAAIAAPTGKAGSGDSPSAVGCTHSNSELLAPLAEWFAKVCSVELQYSRTFERTYLATAPPSRR